MKRKQYVFFWMLITIFLVFSGMTAVAGSDNPYEEALSKTVNYYVYNQVDLIHWQEIVGLAEAGEHVWEDPWQLPEWDIDDLDENSGVLDYIALIFSLDGAGEDPAHMAGRNLVEELADLQGENGSFGDQTMLTYWAMIALDQTAGNYDGEAAVNYLLSQQHDNGGFSWINKTTTPDTDSTGIALLALANHQETAGVADAIGKAIDYLRGIQKETGGFGTDAAALEENCESTACVIMGLLACEEDIVAADWQKDDSTMIDALLRFQLSNGSFCHVADTSSNPLATRQALMALARIVESGVGGSGGSGEPGGNDPSEEKTVRVRVEGHTNSLADERVTVRGTALDALKEAVGEDQVVVPGGLITQIKGESGRLDIGEGINTNWMYYVIRDGEIESGAFDLGAGSYNVEDGDEIVFYLGASDASTWEARTYLPQVSVSPGSITAGETVTIAISAQKYVWPAGLSDLAAEETAAIGNYTVAIGEKTYTSADGQVSIPNAAKGTMHFTVTNGNDQGYPDVVTYKGSFSVGGGGSSGGGNSDEITVKVAVVGKGGKKDILFLADSVALSKDDEYGWTALGALDATGLDWEFSKNNEDFVMEIEGQRNQGQNGWMYKVNGDAPESSARVTKVSKRDEIIWWYSDDPESEGPIWSELADEGSAGGASGGSGKEVTKSTVTGYKDDLAGLTENKLLNPDKKMTEKAAAALKEELAKHTVSLSLNAGKSASFLSDQEVSLLIPEQGLSQATKITVQEVTPGNQPRQFAVQLGSSVYEFGPGGTKFDQPVTIAIKVPLTEDIDINQLFPAWYNEETNTWVTIPAVIDLETGLVVFQIDHFTKFAVIRLPERQGFADVGESMAWAKDAVEILAGKGFINGTGTGFEPKRSISRAEFVKIMVTALGLETKTYEENLFRDVKTGDWFAGYIQSAYENRIITGGQGENFRPRDSITRNEVAAIFCRLQETDPAGSQSTALTFKDAAQIPAWAVQGIHYVHQQGLMTGYGDGTFQGSNSLTRAEAAVTVYRFLGFREK